MLLYCNSYQMGNGMSRAELLSNFHMITVIVQSFLTSIDDCMNVSQKFNKKCS